jgi:hypothetical protein
LGLTSSPSEGPKSAEATKLYADSRTLNTRLVSGCPQRLGLRGLAFRSRDRKFMTKAKSKPAHSIRIDNYQEFREDVRRFADGKYNALIVLGGTGLSKSETVKEMVQHYLIYEGGNPTAFQFYCDLHKHIDDFVILDDVSSRFFKDHLTNSYLKQLTNTKQTKSLRWPTSTLSETTNPPNYFETQSRVVILTNEWESLNEHIRALEGRAYSIIFDPTPTEVHLEVGRRGWFHDQEVFDFVWEYRRLITKPDMRLYVKIAEQKRAGAPWRKRGLEMLIGDEQMQRIAQLLEDPNIPSNKQRAFEFEKRGYGGRTTFYECLKHFRHYDAAKGDRSHPPLLEELRLGTNDSNQEEISTLPFLAKKLLS